MAVTEKQRHELMKAMEGALGPEPAETLMNLLPPVGWADVATKADLDHLRAATKADIDGVRVEVTSEFAAVRSEMSAEFAAVRSAMSAEFAAVRSAMSAEFAAVRSELTLIDERFARTDERLDRVAAEVRADLERGLRQQLVTFLSASAVMLGIAVTLGSRLG